jgi:nucleoside-diphosphate-sugar epimerase
MKVFLTGATGFVGNAILQVLLDNKLDVVALTRRPESAEQLWRRCEVVLGDMRDSEHWQSAAAQCDVVIHAGQQSMGFPITEQSVDVTVEADRLAVEGIVQAFRKQQRLKKLIYTSGLWSYGDRGDEWIDETFPYRPVGINLRRADRERMLFDIAATEGLQVCSMVLGNVYGPGASFRGYVERALRGEHKFIGAGENFMSPVHFRDVGTAYLAALETGRSGERYNICDNQPITAAEHARLLCASVGSPPPGSLSFDDAIKILGKLHATSLVRSIRMRNAKAETELKWKPTYPTFEAGVKASIEDLVNVEN